MNVAQVASMLRECQEELPTVLSPDELVVFVHDYKEILAGVPVDTFVNEVTVTQIRDLMWRFEGTKEIWNSEVMANTPGTNALKILLSQGKSQAAKTRVIAIIQDFPSKEDFFGERPGISSQSDGTRKEVRSDVNGE